MKFSHMLALVTVLMMVFSLNSLRAEEEQKNEAPWNYISLEAGGVDRFLEAHPTYDGRGVVVFILDNGADVHVPGLFDTSVGKPKFIDAQDFTGEGEVKLTKVTPGDDGSVANEKGDLILRDLKDLSYKAEEGAYYLGELGEKQFDNSEFAGAAGAPDINDNGRSDDRFGVLAFPVEGEDFWVVYLDADLNQSMANEKPLRNFKEAQDMLYFHKALPDKQKKTMTFVANIFPEDKKVVFHFADGAHSTHVSGIVAGYQIDGADGFNGVAPGAQLVSCKIGHCSLAGGATVRESMKKAYEYAKDYQVEHKVPVVLNMSYGIGSELEGSTDIDRYLDELILDHPGMIVCTSAGNAGPGISTVGTPAASFMAISVGAVLAQDVARNVYNADLAGHRLLHFSSRGGELDKPDLCAPGACFSSVPLWRSSATMWGTSMASPYAAGAVALLLSGAAQEFPGVEVNCAMVMRALRNSARPLDYCNDLDQGSGMIDVPAAWEMLKTYLARAQEKDDPVLALDIETFCPEGDKGKARAAYWRSVYHPGAEETQVFRVKALFKKDTPADTINNFFRKYTLVPEADFIDMIPESLPLRKDRAAPVTLRYRPEKLREPGIYTGRVAVYDGAVSPENRVCDLLNSVIVPHTFGPDNNYALQFSLQAVEPLQVDHYYLAVPPGASAMEIRLDAVGDRFALARMELCDPEGRTHGTYRGLDTKNSVLEYSTEVVGDELVPGIWELLVYGDYKAGNTSRYGVAVSFFGVETRDLPAFSLDFKPGKTPKGSAKVMNRFNKAVWTEAAGTVWGYGRTQEVSMIDKDEWSYSFSVDPSIKGVRFKVSMSQEAYGLFTDYAINIYDSSGEAVTKSGLSNRFTTVEFVNPGGKGTYTLKMVAGYTHKEKAPFDFTVREEYIYNETIPLKVSTPGAGQYIPLIPDQVTTVDYTLGAVPPVAPKGFVTSGTMTFKARGTEREVFKLSIHAK